MTYKKPEVQSLGDASSVIQSLYEKNIRPFQIDPVTGKRDFNVAYDLDE